MSLEFSEEAKAKKGVWQFQEAKAKLSEVFNKTEESGKQIIIRNKKRFIILNEQVYENYLGSQRSVLEVFARCPHPEIPLEMNRSQETLRDLEL